MTHAGEKTRQPGIMVISTCARLPLVRLFNVQVCQPGALGNACHSLMRDETAFHMQLL